MFSTLKVFGRPNGENCKTIFNFSRLCLRQTLCSTASTVPKTGIVLMNMGGPETTDQVHDYLKRIMTDRDMIQLPFAQQRMGEWIAKRRTPEVQERYKQIGGGSPILKWTQTQGELLCKELDKVSPDTAPHKYYVAFRYVSPFTSDALNQLEADGVKRAVLFSQYPQYSCATSGSSFNQICDHYSGGSLPSGMRMSVIDRWATHPLLVSTFAQLIRKELDQFSPEVRDKVLILFSAHSLPLKAVRRGDTYPFEVGATVQGVMTELNNCNPYHLVWQSKVGPLPWLGPFTDDALKAYARRGHKHFILVPIAFVNEHIETLHELDIEYCEELGKEIGAEQVRRCPAPNDHPQFIQAMVEIVKNHLSAGATAVSPKFLNRCPHCTNKRCYETKKWFNQVCNV